MRIDPRSNNLAKAKPEKVREMAAIWTKQLKEYTAIAIKDLPADAKTNRKK